MSPAIAHNEFNGGEGSHRHSSRGDNSVEGDVSDGFKADEEGAYLKHEGRICENNMKEIVAC